MWTKEDRDIVLSVLSRATTYLTPTEVAERAGLGKSALSTAMSMQKMPQVSRIEWKDGSTVRRAYYHLENPVVREVRPEEYIRDFRNRKAHGWMKESVDSLHRGEWRDTTQPDREKALEALSVGAELVFRSVRYLAENQEDRPSWHYLEMMDMARDILAVVGGEDWSGPAVVPITDDDGEAKSMEYVSPVDSLAHVFPRRMQMDRGAMAKFRKTLKNQMRWSDKDEQQYQEYFGEGGKADQLGWP